MEDEDHNKSFARLQEFDLDDYDDVVGTHANWILKVKKHLNVEQNNDLKSAKFYSAAATKPVLAGWLEGAVKIMERQSEMMEKMEEMINLFKTEALGDKAAIIRLQREALRSKDEQLKSLQTAVQTTVQDTVQTEIRSYGDVLKAPSAPAITTATFRKVVKDVIEDEDRSKNLLVFGLSEEVGEQLDVKLSSVFMDLGEKPRVEAVRFGRHAATGNSKCRPVKVTLGSSTAVQQILSKARALKQTENWKEGCTCLRTVPQRNAQHGDYLWRSGRRGRRSSLNAITLSRAGRCAARIRLEFLAVLAVVYVRH